MISFCWLPPERARAGSAAFGGRTSKPRMISSARRCTAFSSRKTPARDDRRAIMHAENRVLRKTEVEQQTTSMTIFGNVRDSELPPHARAERVEVLAFEVDLARDALGFN